jgi:hypothetical protein
MRVIDIVRKYLEENGYDTVLEAYKESAPLIKEALASIKETYLR